MGYQAVDNTDRAYKYGQVALSALSDRENDKHFLPLLLFMIRLCWNIGRNKETLEAKLKQLTEKGTKPELASSLLLIVLQRFNNK